MVVWSGLDVNRHTRESHIQRSFRAHCGPERQLGGAAAGPARSSRRKSTLLAVPSLLDEKEFLQQMRAGPLDRRFPLFVGFRCMLFDTHEVILGERRCGESISIEIIWRPNQAVQIYCRFRHVWTNSIANQAIVGTFAHLGAHHPQLQNAHHLLRNMSMSRHHIRSNRCSNSHQTKQTKMCLRSPVRL